MEAAVPLVIPEVVSGMTVVYASRDELSNLRHFIETTDIPFSLDTEGYDAAAAVQMRDRCLESFPREYVEALDEIASAVLKKVPRRDI
jgi:hypothetical protein